MGRFRNSNPANEGRVIYVIKPFFCIEENFNEFNLLALAAASSRLFSWSLWQ